MKKYIRIIYYSVISALFLMVITSVLNSISITNTQFYHLLFTILLIRLIVTLYLELTVLLYIFRQWKKLHIKLPIIAISYEQFISIEPQHKVIISTIQLNVIRC